MQDTTPGGVLVVDLQPAYTEAIAPSLLRQTFAYLQSLPEDLPLVAFWVNNELSGDTEESVRNYWYESGASEELLERIEFREKPYAFLRGWMDQGVPHDAMRAVLKALRDKNIWDSRQLDADTLQSLSEDGSQLADPLFREETVEDVAALMRRYERPWATCGGGRDECLLEVELALSSADVSFERIQYLTY